MEEIETHCWEGGYPFAGGNHEGCPNNVQTTQTLRPGSKRPPPRTKVDARKTSQHVRPVTVDGEGRLGTLRRGVPCVCRFPLDLDSAAQFLHFYLAWSAIAKERSVGTQR